MADGGLFELRVLQRERAGSLLEFADARRAVAAEHVEPLSERAITASGATLPGESSGPSRASA